jgi:hypothetical protein
MLNALLRDHYQHVPEQMVPIPPAGLRVGRSSSCDLALPDESTVSGKHADLYREDDQLWLRDLDSSNGTFVNGVPIVRFCLRDNDVIEVGRCHLGLICDVRFAKKLMATDPTSTRKRPLFDASHFARIRDEYEFYRQPVSIVVIDAIAQKSLPGTDDKQLRRRLLASMADRLSSSLPVGARICAGPHNLGVAVFAPPGASKAAHAIVSNLASELSSTGITIEDRVVAPSAQTFALSPGTSEDEAFNSCMQHRVATTPSSAELPAPDPAVVANRASDSLIALRWIHLSDLHFGAGSQSWALDRREVLEAIRRDIAERHPVAPDRVFVTGDVAYSGSAHQYEMAQDWFQRLAIPLETIRVVPGNHDIDRSVAQVPAIAAMHEIARRRPAFLNEALHDEVSRELLTRKLKAFHEFRAQFFPRPKKGAMGYGGSWFSPCEWYDYAESATLKGRRYSVWGLSTVWISDRDDGDVERLGDRGAGFVPNMLLPTFSCTLLGGDRHERSADILQIVLTHHPVEWLVPSSRNAFEGALSRSPHVHLCGHVHAEAAELKAQFGRTQERLTFVAAAAHGDEDGGSSHGYSWGAIRWVRSQKCWQAGWAPRTYVQSRREMRPDSTRHDLDQEGFAWRTIPLKWEPPA